MKRMIFFVLCAMVTDVVLAEPPTLESVAVTPSARTLSVGQSQRFTASGTFSDGSTHALGPAVADIAPGYWGTCVLLTSGGVKCWGDNDKGQLGDGTASDSVVPRRVKSITGATAVASLYEHACALLARGGVRCWGSNELGQLGSGSFARFSSWPVVVTGTSSGTALGVGWSHSCALLASGEIQCWGANGAGELGNGTRTLSRIPVRVTGISTATALATGAMHNCALLAGGAVQCWGNNHAGELGNGTVMDSGRPVSVIGINGATAIAAGWHFSCALLASGAVKCWGNNLQGELGDGSGWPNNEYSSIPVAVPGITTAVAITAGGFHVCALLSDGSARCWGDNRVGQLGNGSTTALTSTTPLRVMGINAPVTLAAGAYHTCALLSDGAMRCWGSNVEGELGNRRRTVYPTPNRWPVNVVGTPGVVWQSIDPSRATIRDGGLATARSVGNTTITAITAGFINDNAVLTVK